jgi:hypothetical protein
VTVPGVGLLRERRRLAQRARGLRKGDAALVARALAAAVTPLDIPGLTPGPDARRILVLPKVSGTEDLVATLRDRGDVGLAAARLDRAEIKAVFRAMIGDGHELLTDLDYRPQDAAFDAVKARYRALLVPVMRSLRDELRLAAVVSANVTYYAERELAAACEEVGLPFLVLHKESIRSPAQREAFTRAYRERTGAFLGRSVAVYNEDERRSQIDGGVVTDAAVVGCPRIDELHAWRQDTASNAERSDGPIVLFAIDPRAGTWTPFDRDVDGSGRVAPAAPRWDELALQTEAAFVALAGRFPDHPFIIKAKVGHAERLEARLAAQLPDGLPANVRVVTTGTATDLVRAAGTIIAFNSTVVAEGLAAGVPVVVPAFAEAADPDATRWCYATGDAVTRVSAPEDLADAVIAAQRRPRTAALDADTVATLEQLVGNADGLAGERAWEWLQAAMDTPGRS